MEIRYDYMYRAEMRERVVPLTEVADIIRTCRYGKTCRELRWKIGIATHRDERDKFAEAEKLPIMRPAVGAADSYTGIVMMSFRCDGPQQLPALRARANALPQTLMSFAGSSGKSLKILVRFTLPDGSLPAEDGPMPETDADGECSSRQKQNSSSPTSSIYARKAKLFHEHAYRKAVKYYEMELEAKAERAVPRIERGCRIPADESVYLDTDALPVIISQPEHTVAESIRTNRLTKDGEVRFRTVIPGYGEEQMMMTKFQCCHSAFRPEEYDRMDLFLLDLARSCQKSGLPEEFAVRRVLHITPYGDYDLLVRRCFHTVYGTGLIGTESSIPQTALQTRQLRDFFERRYRFRRNVVTAQYEYFEAGTHMYEWSPLTREVYNRMTVQVLDEGINAWDKDIRRFVESSNIETYNPIRDYIVGLPVWDGIDRITPLALRVPTDNRDWPRYLHRWLLGMVAQWMGIEPMYGLTMVPLLVGKQGDGKSTFCRLLLPPELREYYTDRIDFSNRNEAERALSRFCLINIDEFDSITRSQTAFLKHILQKTSYKQRRLYTQTVEENVRYAAFIGTTNDPTPLVDPSGSRRYLCIRTAGAIDTLSPFDYQQIYAQLRAEIGRNERCYFDREDEERIQQSNMEFQQFDSLEEIFREMFRKPTYAETGREMSVSSIVNAMHQRYSVIKCNDGTYRRLGRILRRNEFTHHKTAATHNYMVVEKPEAE